MALYSWFLRTNNKPGVKTVKYSRNLQQASNTVKCIENYTMWPTAKIKINAEITVSEFEDKSVSSTVTVLSTKSALIGVKS
jgi:hypothetical protein